MIVRGQACAEGGAGEVTNFWAQVRMQSSTGPAAL